MPLTVASIAYPFAPVGPHAVGGAEQILTDLDQALVAAGHRSLVVACEGSRAAGQLFAVPLPPAQSLDEADRVTCRDWVRRSIDALLQTFRVDLIHMHGLDFCEYDLPANIPVLVTLHMPIAWYPPDIWTRCSGDVHLQCVSEAQRRSCPPGWRDLPVVTNGVALPPFIIGKNASDFAVALGRVCPEKNFHTAFQAGTLADTAVLLGGQVFPYKDHQDYFREKIQPLLDPNAPEPRHQFLGPLSPGRRQSLLAEAKCLLHPTLAPETSSLVAMEALAAGTPVIAFRSGALPDIIEEGVTGFLVDSAESMADAISRVGAIQPEVCRNTAERRFSKRRMVQDYFHLYRSLVGKRQRERLYA